MTTQASSTHSAYEPTPAQLERVVALRRFNWLFVYTPVVLLFLAVLVILGLLLWGSFSPNISGTAEFVSAVADIFVALTILPLFLLCAIVPIGTITFVVYRRTQPKKPHGRGHVLLWRLDTLVDRLLAKSQELLPRVTGIVIEGHARAAYLSALVERLRRLVGRS